ncbi:hypothetical protein BV20DRAFT_1055891 [Pilatotrama ljubarskyi]|nr:hypothetical protein BV20DRAFT_1055891 [Pilatotrama ljubarskyi]
MPSLSSSRLSSSNALATVISALEILQEASDVIIAAPYLGHILSAALGIARTVEKIRGDKERYIRLARRAAELSRHVKESIESDPRAVNENLKLNLIDLQLEDVEVQLKRTPLSRFLLQGSISQLLDEHIDRLDSAWRAFDTSCLIALRMKLERQAVYDDRSQLRLFRWSDFRCYKVRGTYEVDGDEVGEEWEGRWDGRAIVVRTIRTNGVFERYMESTMKLYTATHHPYVAQVLGYSHPSLSEKFYVMDTGVMPLILQFRGKETFFCLVQWLQHVVDYQDAFRCLERQGFPITDCLGHDRCLQSAMLNEEGRLIVDAADFRHSNLGCFQSRLRTLYDEEHGTLPPGKDFAYDDDVALHASTLLAQLRSNIGADPSSLDLEWFLRSDLAKIWTSHQFQRHTSARWGAYGYIKRDGSDETFVRLGNIYEFVKPTEKISTFFLRRPEGGEWEPARDYPWPEETVVHVFELSGELGRTEDIAVVRTLPDDCEYHDFFWNHAQTIANANGLRVHDIVIFEEIFHYAGAVILDDDTDDIALQHISRASTQGELPDHVYFHQLPLLATGEAPSPWGYWSLDAEPTPGPWPAIELPGVELSCRVQSNFARVAAFESEILEYLNRLRHNRLLNTVQELGVRFQEI